MATDFDSYTADERTALLAAYPRGSGFRETFLAAVARGVEHRPQSTFGTWSADVLERADPDFQRPNFCGRVLGRAGTTRDGAVALHGNRPRGGIAMGCVTTRAVRGATAGYAGDSAASCRA